MKRTDAEAHDSNRFTDGNPSLSIAATVVEETWLNNVQEEICNVVEDAGITLDGSDEDQLLEALRIIIGLGGVQITGDILDNQSSFVNLTGVLFDKTLVKSAKFLCDIMRRDDGQSATELFEITAIYNEEDDTWAVRWVGQGASDSGMTFGITSAGQIQYKSTSFAGANYDGDFRVSHIRKVSI